MTSALWTTGPLAALGERPRMLWLRLATGPEATAIPGVVLVQLDRIAASLGWTMAEVQQVSSSIPSTTLRVDWSAGVAWIPALLRWSPPASSKNVLGWRATWSALPATPIADDIYAELRTVAAARSASCARAFESLPPPRPAPRPEAPAATIEIRGVTVTASGIPEGRRAELVLEVGRLLGVEVTIAAPAAVDTAPPAEALALPTLEPFTPQPAAKGRRTRAQAALEDRVADIDRVLRYQAERRAEAFALAGRTLVPLDEDECRKAIAGLLGAGRTVVELQTVCDRLYERVGAERTAATRSAAAGWWTAATWHPHKVGELLRLDVGAVAPTGVGALAKLINEGAPPGASTIPVLSATETRPLAHLLELGSSAEMILATATALAQIAAEQERQLERRELARGEGRIVRLWGGRMFRLSAWTAIQTAVTRFDGGDRSVELFVAVTAAMQATEPAKPRAVDTA
jgi:hypothetical protein